MRERRARDARREGGYAALWVVITLALLTLAGLGFAAMDPDTEVPLLWLGACALVAGAGLAIEARHDLYEFCQLAGSFALIGAGVLGMVAGLGSEPHPVAGASAVVLGLAAIAAFATRFRMSRAEEVLPNVLTEHFDASSLSELGGVQFVVTHSDAQVPAGGECVVLVHAQNGMSEARTLEVRLRPRADIGKGNHLDFDKAARMELPAGAAGTLSIPVAVHPKARGTYPISVEPQVHGSGGERLRVYRARAFQRKIGGGFQAFALLFGFFVWGGGITVKLRVARNKHWKSMPVEEAAPSRAEIVFEPDRAMLEGIRMRA